ncbi:DUF58 domain-containing protein [Lapillicoccus jejuensis]|uniref:Uncharacterized protein (DUF58 family) n=1 Tax=Lapillicoccus jejuensis TaxID=402171 RepID=A0A542DVG7_9MICO|nr:DUF58 domain-containing protein [Lapillicoccus jejuensis]TQJ07090.1 uncharacterized protein (DUF58 family) [Lapillicoccus jejuensis]
MSDVPAGSGPQELRRELPAWVPTAAQGRAVAVSGLGLLVAVLAHRADVLVLVTPLLLVAAWARLARPSGTPTVVTRLGRRTAPEGTVLRWDAAVELPAHAEDAVVGLAPSLFVEDGLVTGSRGLAREDAVPPPDDPEPGDTNRIRPARLASGPEPSEANPIRVDDGTRVVRTAAAVRLTRWGRRTVGPEAVLVLGPFAGYRSGPVELTARDAVALPASSTFDGTAPLPHPEGLVGVHRSSRQGSGGEFATLRPFQPGDRLRRIRWPVSLRTGTLHVATTFADQDTAVVLVVDAFSDLGPREGVDGRATSLDLTVRAAAAVAAHHLGAGDRVGLRVVGSSTVRRLPTASGSRQLRRVLDSLAALEAATERVDDGEWATAGIPSGALVVVLSPLVDPSMVAAVGRLGSRGLTTVVVDTMPEHLWEQQDDPYAALAWRLRRVTRSAQLDRLFDLGVPTVPWRGPGSLDAVLRDLSRRTRAPRVARR